MTGILAQTIAMVSFGNEYLKGNQLKNFFPENSVFQYCNSVDFREMKKPSFFSSKREVVIAENPIEWFRYLSDKNCKTIKLYYQRTEPDDYRLVAFVGGGGNWFIECVYQDYSDFWISNWNHDKTSKTIPWNVLYGKAMNNQPIMRFSGNLPATRAKLKEILIEVADFAFQETTENWGKTFEKALATLDDKNPVMNYYKDFIVRDNYSLESLQLLISACNAFVFGGMGSWNDFIFENRRTNETYSLLSSKLYNAIAESILVAVNNDKIQNASA